MTNKIKYLLISSFLSIFHLSVFSQLVDSTEYLERDKSNPYKSISQDRYSLKEVMLSGGFFYETPIFSKDNFCVTRPGFYFGISQILKGSLVGGVQLRYSEWKIKDNESIGILSDETSIGILSFLSLSIMSTN